MEVNIDQVKRLREKTGISVMQCRKALQDAKGDIEVAMNILKKKGAEIALKKSDRELGSGTVSSYIHSDHKLGVLLELSCETDFVARNKEFVELADDIAMHIAAMNPLFLTEKDVREADREELKELYKKDVDLLNKEDALKEKILEGKIDSYFSEKILLTQAFVKEPNITTQELLERSIQKMGERIEVRRFVRFALFD